MIKIIVVLFIFAVLVQADDPIPCSDGIKTAFADSKTKCKGSTTTPADLMKCMGTETRSRLEFAPFVKICPDATVKGCLQGQVEKSCPGLTKD